MTTRSQKLGEADITSSGLTYLYTCPANTRTIVKWASATNVSGGTHAVQLGYTNAANSVSVSWFVDAALADSKVLGGELWSVLDPGDRLYVYFTGTTGLEVTFSGAELPII